MRPHDRPVGTVALALVAAIETATVIAWTPPLVSFGLAVIAAVGWCIWLERHPTT